MIYIGTGSNLGNKREYLAIARERVSQLPDTQILRVSKEICTKPYGKTDQPDFLNQIIELETKQKPEMMLSYLQDIEKECGRERKERWGARTLDLDILLWNHDVIKTENLNIPHPDMHNRLFILESLMELIPDFEHPVLGETIKEIYNLRREN